MELDSNNLPISPAAMAVGVICAHLDRAQGIRSKLNQSCKIGIDAILADAIDGRLPEASLPCIRIAFGTSSYTLASNAGVALYKIVNLHLFFLYSIGKHGGSVLPSQFTDLRDRHIRWNIEQLKDRQVLPSDAIGLTAAQHKDDAGNVFWWWPDGEQDILQEDETPFDVLGIGIPINPSSGMACSRVDLKIAVKNHATFNSDPDPDLFKDAMTLLVPNEIPVGAIDGANVAFTLSKTPKIASNGNSSLMLFLNNAILPQEEYTIIGAAITLNTAPEVGDTLTAYYYS